MGVKLFVSGEIAYAADVNEFLMEQSIAKFANVAARNVAFGNGIPISQGGDGKPQLKEGQFCYLEENSLSSNGSGTPEVQFYNGTTWVGAENFAVSDGEITDVKVNAAAAIQLSKLAAGTPGQIVVCNASGVPTYVTLANDATINSSGQLTIGSTAVTLGTETVGDYVERITGTANQITVTGSGVESASITLTLPQDIHTSANPTFAGLTADSVRIGITAANEIDTSSGNLILDSTGGTIQVDDILSVTGAASVAGLFTAASNMSVTGSAAVSGAASVAGLLTAANNVSISGSTAVSGAASVAGLFTAASGITSSGNVSVTGSISVSGNVVSHAIPETVASLTNAIDGKIVKVSSGLALTTTGGSWTNGTQFTVINTSAAALTITASTGTTFLAAPLSGSNVKLRAQYSTATFIYEQGAGWYVIGDLTST